MRYQLNQQQKVVSLTLLLAAILATLILTLPVEGFPGRESLGRTSSQKVIQPAGIDLDVTFISRSPLYKAYCVEYPWDVLNQPGIPSLCQGTEDDKRWPTPGEIVTFTAHIINKGTIASPPYTYSWFIDGMEVLSDTLSALAPAAEATADYQWPWAHGLSANGQQATGDHTVSFEVDTANIIAETYESNNRLDDLTGAMSFRINFTPEMYAAYNVPVDPAYPFSAEDWIQKQITAMNANFAGAIYPATPTGSALRVRINSIGISQEDPPPDGFHDGGWFVSGDYRNGASDWYDSSSDIDWGMIHELSHQVSIIDLYAIGVYASNVFVKGGDGTLANVGFGWEGGGLMGGGDISPYTDTHRYSSHTAAGSSTYTGFRNGFYGSYLYDIPKNNYLLILDNQGNPAADVEIKLYQRTGPWDWTGQMGVDNVPEISGKSNSNGIFPLPNRSVNGGAENANGHTLANNPFRVVDIIGNQGLLLAHLTKGNHEEFHWLDITQFNLAYWRGDTLNHTIVITSHVPSAGAPLAPDRLNIRVAGAQAILDWVTSKSTGVIGYRVYRATPPHYDYISVSPLIKDTHFSEEFWGPDGQHRLYAVTAVKSSGLESGFSEFAYAPGLNLPVAVVIAPDGSRTVLNQANMYPLLRQKSDGQYTSRIVNVHNDLWNTSFIAYDPLGRLMLSGIGEFPNERSAVRLFDKEMRPLWAFGDEGSSPGQFGQPAGIDWWGPACTYAETFKVDENTLLLAHFNGTLDGVQGENGTGQGTSFDSGKYGQGVLLNNTDTLTYPTAGNLQHTEGALEFWIRPNWDGDDGGNHTLFWWGEGENFFHLRKDGISNLVFDYFYSGGSCGSPTNVANWKADEWHHVAITWEENDIRLYVDGQRVNRTLCGGTAKPSSNLFYVGSGAQGEGSVEATYDEFRVSNRPRAGISESCGRIVVADSKNHRIQAFDLQGALKAAYGSFGTAAGKFSKPQGVIVDHQGRVVVVDQGNNRLVSLNFDGTEFSYLESFKSGFSEPTGLSLDPVGRIYVADSGNNRIVVLSPDGEFLEDFKGPDDGYGGTFSYPRGVAFDPAGSLAVADSGNHRVVSIYGIPGDNRIRLPVIQK